MNSTRKTKRRNYKHTAHGEWDVDGRYGSNDDNNNEKTMSLFTRQVDKKRWIENKTN